MARTPFIRIFRRSAHRGPYVGSPHETEKSYAKPATYLGGNFTVSASNDSGGAITYSRVLLDELWLLDGMMR